MNCRPHERRSWDTHQWDGASNFLKSQHAKGLNCEDDDDLSNTYWKNYYKLWIGPQNKGLWEWDGAHSVTSMRIRVHVPNYKMCSSLWYYRVHERLIKIQALKGRMSGNENKVIMRVIYHCIMNNYKLFMCIMILSFQIIMDLPLYSYTVQTWKEKIKHILKHCLPITVSPISIRPLEIHKTQITVTYFNT
jgi:hypothetical protein